MIHIKENKIPLLHKPSFLVDKPIHERLNEIEIFSLMNKPNFTLFLGKAGSGKSSMVISFLNSPQAFKKCYHDIILFCPPNSRASIKDDFWGNNLEEDSIFDDLNLENLQYAYNVAENNAREGFKTLIILDDVQKYLKGDCEKFLLHMVNNRRHACLSIWLCCQNYKNIPLQVRQNLTDLFIFKVNKNEALNIFNEQIELFKDKFDLIISKIFNKPHDFLYINSLTQRFFDNWNEIIIE